MENILKLKPELEIYQLENDKKIAKVRIVEVTEYEIKIAVINRIEEFTLGDSVQCKFKHKNQNVRFNAKIKSETALFLMGELIFDNEKNYLRVNDDIKINYKKISVSKIDNYMNEVYSSKDDNVNLSSLVDSKDPYFKLFQYLISRIDELNQTVTNLTDIIQDNKQKIFEELFVNISASGMKIKKEESVNLGDILFIEIKLEINLRYHIIKIIGEVIQVENDYFIIEYRMISNKSKEKIIRYSLQREREQIRLKRG